MNKSDLVKRIARQSKLTHAPLTQAQVQQVLDSLFTLLAEELSRPGGRVEIEHFGVLESRLIPNSPRGLLIGKDGVTRKPPTERLVSTFRMSKKVRSFDSSR